MAATDLSDVSDAPLSDIEIAAIPCAFGTALGLLDRAGVMAGQEVLITGASGNVGLAAVQLAAKLGAHVTAIAAPSKADTVCADGATEVIARDAPLPENCFHAVVDLVGGPVFPALIDALRPGGHLAMAGAIAGPIVTADLRRLYLRDITLHGCTYQSPSVFARLIEMVRAASIRPRIFATYPLRDIARAQADFQAKTHVGKLVLLPETIET